MTGMAEELSNDNEKSLKLDEKSEATAVIGPVVVAEGGVAAMEVAVET